jgi:hypothetical protein
MIGFVIIYLFFLSLILVLLRCEQSHGERCTESFMRENVMEEDGSGRGNEAENA